MLKDYNETCDQSKLEHINQNLLKDKLYDYLPRDVSRETALFLSDDILDLVHVNYRYINDFK